MACSPFKRKKIFFFTAISLSSFVGFSDAAEVARSSIEEVIVSARRKIEVAQDVPASISVQSEDDIHNKAIRGIQDLQYSTPSLQVQQNQSALTSTNITIRGQGQVDALLVVDPSVGIYMDGVYLGTHVGTMATVMQDVQRVEILKGPQGTLYGKNTTGGAFNIITKEPVDRWEGELDAGAGNHGFYNVGGMVNIPISPEKAALRIVGQYSDSDGYGENRVNGHAFNDQQLKNIRASLLLTPIDDLEILLRAEYTKLSSGGVGYQPIYVDPAGAIGVAASLAATGTPFQAQAAYAPYMNDGHYSGSFDGENAADLEVKNYAAIVTYDMGDLQFKSLTGAKKVDSYSATDLDGTPYPLFQGNTPTNFDQYSQEFQLTGSALNDKLDFTLGLFYFYMDGTDQNFATTLAPFYAPLPGPVTVTDYDLTTKSPAVYGQATYQLTDTVSFTGGLRYTKEDKTTDLRNRIEDPIPFLAGCNLPDIAPGAPCNSTYETKDENLSYTAGLEWKINTDVLTYAKTSRGFKGGGVNGRTSSNPLTVSPFAPETVTDYEIGLKSSWLDNRLRANLAAYHSDYEDIQRAVFIVDSGQPISVIRTAKQATINGFEAELTALPIDDLVLQGTLTYTDPKYDDYKLQETVGGPFIDHSNEKFQNVSKWVYDLSATYTLRSDAVDTTFNLSWYWRDKADMFPTGAAVDSQGHDLDVVDAYGLLNGTVTLYLKNFGAEISLWGKNLTDERYIQTIFDVSSANAGASLGGAFALYGEPRSYGVQFKKYFGSTK